MAVQATSEEQIRLRRRARRRLLGAATLLLLAAIILPMVLDKEPRPLDQDIEIHIPSQESATVGGQPAAITVPQPVAPAPAPEPAPEPMTRPLAQPETPRPTAEMAKPVARPEPARPGQPTPPVAAKPEQDRAARSEPAAKPVEAAPEKPPASASFAVQIGVFGSADNVRQVRDKLAGAGIYTYTEKLPNGTTRVRAGPFKSRAQADHALGKIAAAGVEARVVMVEH